MRKGNARVGPCGSARVRWRGPVRDRTRVAGPSGKPWVYAGCRQRARGRRAAFGRRNTGQTGTCEAIGGALLRNEPSVKRKGRA